MPQFTKIAGDIKLYTETGDQVAVHVEGVRVPDGADDIGKYFGEMVAKQLGGLTSQAAAGMTKQVAKLESSLAEREAELRQAREEIDNLKKATRGRRNTPAE